MIIVIFTSIYVIILRLIIIFVVIGRFRKKPQQRKVFSIPYLRNHQIKASVVFLVDKDGEQLGEKKLSEALKLAEERDLDLIEVSPKSNPPVAKIMSWSKFKYEQDKKRKESRNKSIEQKEMWFKPFIGEGDLDHKLKKVEQFIKKKHPVKLTIRSFRRVRREHQQELMEKIIEKISEFAETEEKPKFQGRFLSIIVKPRKTKLIKVEEQNDKEKTSEQTTEIKDLAKKTESKK